jgi:uncharacterized pyridoxamine 5'-phosphate oxidase family protein
MNMAQSTTLNKVTALLKSQKLAVLATLSDDRPYCSLVVFAETEDCKSILFATDRDTAKYWNLLNNHKVSLLIDDRTDSISGDFGKQIAITAIGTAQEITLHERLNAANLLITKHPQITGFLNGSDNTLFRVRISDYIIAGFSNVEKLHMENG